MWMMGYNDGVEFNTIQDSLNGRKLRPLMPKTTTATCTNPPCTLARIHATTDHLLALNHHQWATATATGDRSKSTQQVVVSSSRWNPTPDQLQALEELYRRGTRTPSAEQIQHITAQLRRYGKIEGKNVFYWFQNHKARERQKRRRQQDDEENNINNKESSSSSPPARGNNGTRFEVEESKNWVSPTNSSTIADQKNVSTQEAEKAAAAECKADGWLQFDEGDQLQQGRRNATWRMMHLSCSSSPTINPLLNSPPPPPGRARHEFIILDDSAAAAGGDQAQTLQLFPMGSGGCDDDDKKEEEESGAGGDMNGSNSVTPSYQFFEFLPLKN